MLAAAFSDSPVAAQEVPAGRYPMLEPFVVDALLGGGCW